MKYLKNFESIKEKEIDFNKVYRYGNSGYVAFGKIEPFTYIKTPYKLKDIFDNDYDDIFRTTGKYLSDVDFVHLSKFYMKLTIENLLYIREATTEETEKYNLAISTNKFNL